jgi:hypothetical protein
VSSKQGDNKKKKKKIGSFSVHARPIYKRKEEGEIRNLSPIIVLLHTPLVLSKHTTLQWWVSTTGSKI